MPLANIASHSLGARIKTYSSCLNPSHQPGNILDPNEDTLWETAEGIPQFVIVSLEDLSVRFRSINEVGFMFWHDYQTNPKEVEMWVAQTTEQEFVFWARFGLEQKKGIQLYQIKPLPSRFIYIKISITETYGAFQTYLNQVFFMAQGVGPLFKTQGNRIVKSQKDVIGKKPLVQNKKNTKKELDLQDLQSNLNELVEMDRRISRSKSKSNKKIPKNQQKKLNLMSRQGDPSSKKRPANIKPIIDQQQLSKGSLSGNNDSKRAGRSIYYRQSEQFSDDNSHEYISNDYQQSGSSRNNNNLKGDSNGLRGIKAILQRGEQRNEYDQREYSQQQQQSQPFSHSLLQSNNTAMSPSLNLTSQYNPYNQDLISSGKNLGREKVSSTKKGTSEREIRFMKKEGNRKGGSAESNGESENLYGEEDEEEDFDGDQREEGELQEEDDEEEQQQFSNDLVRNTPKYKEVSYNQEQEQLSEEEEEQQLDDQQQQHQSSHHQSSQSQQQQQQQSPSQTHTSSQSANNYNIALFALSKHVVRLQDNMQQIQRRVEVLDMKVAHSHQKLQKEMLERVEVKVEEIVDRRLRKIWSLRSVGMVVGREEGGQQGKVRNIYGEKSKERSKSKSKSNKKPNQAKPVEEEKQPYYKKNLTKQFFKSDYYQDGDQQNMAQQRDKTKTKRRVNDVVLKNTDRPLYQDQPINRLKASKSFANITNNYDPKYGQRQMKEFARNEKRNDQTNKGEKNPSQNPKGINQEYISNLLQRLNSKLKEREAKLHRMQEKQQKQFKQRQQTFDSKRKMTQKEEQNYQEDKRKKYFLKEKNYNRRAMVGNTDEYGYR